MKFKLFKLFVVLFIFYQNFYAQYSVYDYDLIRTTFERTFNKEIISTYLSGDEASNVNAALLSIANSKDTSFIPVITKLDFNKYGKFIAFALGELGPSSISSKYLYAKINSTKDSLLLRYCYDALGKVGNKKYLDLVLNKIDYGVPLAFYQFDYRKTDNKKSVVLKSLFRILLSSRNDSLKLNDVLFALSRIGADSTFIPLLTSVLFNNDKNTSVQSKIFALAAFHKLKYFPPLPELFKLVLLHKDWRIRTEAVKACSNYNFSNINDLKLYVDLLFDKNPNTARQTAISLKNIIVPALFKPEINKTLRSIIKGNHLSPSVIGELFVSFAKLNERDAQNIVSEFKNVVENKYIFKLISEVPLNAKFAFKLLKSKKFNITPGNENEYFTALMSLQDSLQHSEEYAQYIIDNFQTGSPAAVGIISSSIDDELIMHKRLTLINIITTLINTHKDDDNYLETFPTLAEIAKKISPTFYGQVLGTLSTSKILSIQNYSLQILGRKIKVKRTADLFENFWEFAFKYGKAKITTNKGNFIIRFTPGYAPISVGNFCYLASEHFFDGVSFHRVVPNFVIQTGDKLGTGWGGPGYEIKSEFSPLPFTSTAVGMASAGRDTEGSQWFVMHSDFPHLNGRYTVFGYVINGKSVVNKINISDKIIQINLIK